MKIDGKEATVEEIIDGLIERDDPLTQFAGRKIREAWDKQSADLKRAREDADNWRRQALEEDKIQQAKERYLNEVAMYTLDGILLEHVPVCNPELMRNFLYAACRRRWLERN